MARARPAPDQLLVWRKFLTAHSCLVRRLDEDLRSRHDLPLEWYDVLVQLNEAGGELRMSELAAAVLITAPNCTRLVDRMVAAGLVERRPDPDDARGRRAVLTATGRARLRAAAPTHLEGIDRHFTGLLADGSEDGVGAFLGRVLASVDAGEGSRP